MVHEMVHLALPDLDERYNWLSEGLAVYIEPIARVQSGDLPAKGVWSAMMRDMPKGLPGPGENGLDNTSSWASTYWGGALFCLIADVEIRKRTSNRLGLRDAMRGVLASGGNHESRWSIARVLSTADAAVGVDVLTRLHDEMGPRRMSPNIDKLWRELGLKSREDAVEIDDAAPLAAVRAAIMK
jgi:predicted metalloprotease with PDZ domain